MDKGIFRIFSLLFFILLLSLSSCNSDNEPDPGEMDVTAAELTSQPSFVHQDKSGDKIVLCFKGNKMYVKGLTPGGEVTQEMEMAYTLSGGEITINYLMYGYMEMQCTGKIWKYKKSNGEQILYLSFDRNDLVGSYLNKDYRFSSDKY